MTGKPRKTIEIERLLRFKRWMEKNISDVPNSEKSRWLSFASGYFEGAFPEVEALDAESKAIDARSPPGRIRLEETEGSR